MSINGCKFPSNFNELDPKTQNNIINYLNQLNPIEVRAYGIAKEHLKTSFNIIRSNGYNDWLKEEKERKKKEQEQEQFIFEEHKE